MGSPGVRVVVVAALLMLAEAGVGSGLRAQDASDWLRVDVVRAVPGSLENYIELQLTEVTPALQAPRIPWRSVWRTVEFGNTYELHIGTPLGDLADYDVGRPLARVIEPDKYQHLLDRLRRFTVSRESYAIRYRPGLSVASDEVGSRYLNRVTTVQVAPGRARGWTAFLEQRLPQFRAANLVFGVYERVFGPGPAAWQIAENHAASLSSLSPILLPARLVTRPGTKSQGSWSRSGGRCCDPIRN
jgi:hypothetical protein